MRTLLSFILLICITTAHTQVGINTNNPQSTLDVRALDPANPDNSTGITIPAVKNLPTTGANPGQIVYHETNNDLYYFNGTKWRTLFIELDREIGDVKFSAETNDHKGWFKLDGRLLTALSLNASQIVNATSLNLTTNLPNANNRILKSKNTGNVGDIGGASTFNILPTNLPSTPITGSVGGVGNHTHSNPPNNHNTTPNTINRRAQGNNGGVAVVAIQANQAVATTAAPNHTHTFNFNSGGSDTPVNFELDYVNVNAFIYLGI